MARTVDGFPAQSAVRPAVARRGADGQGDALALSRPRVRRQVRRGGVGHRRLPARDTMTVKKIPKAVLSRCEWGKDDYSLKVENLPKAPPPKGQMELIPADGDGMKPSDSTREGNARQEAT